MTYRANEYAELGVAARWLEREKAAHAYAFALKYASSKRYGLNDTTVANAERLEISSYSVADSWLKQRLPRSGTVQVVYGEDEVCVVEAQDFLENWQEIFTPSRDDAIVLHNLEPVVLFYCHEEELEIGRRTD